MRKISPVKRGKELVSSALKDRIRASLIAQLIKNLPAMREDPLEKGKATHSGILAQRISWTV